MPRRTKAELTLEFHRQSAIFEAILDFEKAEMPLIGAYSDLCPSKADMLEMVANGKQTMSGVISGLQTAINDFQRGLEDYSAQTHPLLAPEEQGPDARKFLAYYRARTGRGFYQDVTPPRKIAQKALRRGAIATEVEYDVAVEFLNDLSQRALSADDCARLTQMVAHLKARVEGALQPY